MKRRKPFSNKQKKEQLQLKRAIKRGDVEPLPPEPDRRRKGKSTAPHIASSSSRNPASVESSQRLQSSFVKLSADFLDETRILASKIPLARPIPSHVAILHDVSRAEDTARSTRISTNLTCPKRPKWRYEMSKKEVEANEEGLFKKWLAQMDTTIAEWNTPVSEPQESSTEPSAQGQERDAELQTQSGASDTGALKMPRAPTSFERNLEVWRQLWRVVEISQIILILLDSRCALLHYPPSLASYLSTSASAPQTRIILVLTKVDISGPERAEAWTTYLQKQHPGIRIIQVESYAEKEAGSNTQGSRKVYEPHLPSVFRRTLVDALRAAHAELVQPPESIRSDPERLKKWRPRIRGEVDWDAVMNAQGGQVGSIVRGTAAPRPHVKEDDEGAREEGGEGPNEMPEGESEFVTIGLIGQPNVGKSSLLNALFGAHKVKASRTPGKTKHFQTLFWTHDVRLVDCPGLVMPNLVPMEMQVLSGILPISRVSAVPLCVHFVAQLLPLEEIYQLAHPVLVEAPEEDKRTWREGMQSREQCKEETKWTAIDILTAYALKQGWVTAKAGRPDINRAGNAILRTLAEGRIRWAFWPPDADVLKIQAHQGERGSKGLGIWIPHDGDLADIESNSEDEGHDLAPETDEEEVAATTVGEDEESDTSETGGGGGTLGRFGALLLQDDGPSGSESEGSD